LKSIILAIVGLIAAYVIVLQIGYFHGVFGVQRHHLESASFILVAALVLRVWLSKAGPDGQKESGAHRLGVVVALVAGGAYFSAVGAAAPPPRRNTMRQTASATGLAN
jgi:hypothetical protein